MNTPIDRKKMFEEIGRLVGTPDDTLERAHRKFLNDPKAVEEAMRSIEKQNETWSILAHQVVGSEKY